MPDVLWGDPTRQPQFWCTAYHTLFYLDLYLSDATDGFMPPAPFTLSELDPAGVLPEHVYSKAELPDYLAHGRGKARARIESLKAQSAVSCADTVGWTRTAPVGTTSLSG